MGNMEKFQKRTTCVSFFVPAHILVFARVSEKQQKTKQKKRRMEPESAFLSDFLQDRAEWCCVSFGERAPDARLSISFFFRRERFPQWSPLGHRPHTPSAESAPMALCGNLKNRQSAQGVTSLLLLTSACGLGHVHTVKSR